MAYVEIEIPMPTVRVRILEESESLAEMELPSVPLPGDTIHLRNDGRLRTVKHRRFSEINGIEVIVE